MSQDTDRDTIDYIVSVMQAYQSGNDIQSIQRRSTFAQWMDCKSPYWDWCNNHYRIKPEPDKPKTRLIRVKELPRPCYVNAGGYIQIICCYTPEAGTIAFAGMSHYGISYAVCNNWKWSPANSEDWYSFTVSQDGNFIKA